MALVDYLYLNALFSVGWFCLAAGVLALIFSLVRQRQRDYYFSIAIYYAAASVAAAVYLFSVALIRLAYHTGETGFAAVSYRAALIAAPLCALLYILMHMRLLRWNVYRYAPTVRVLVLAVVLSILLVLLPPPFGVFASGRLQIADGVIRPDYGLAALPYYAAQIGLLLFLAVAVFRGALSRGRHRPAWLLHSVALLALAITPMLDMLREAAILVAPFPVSWVGFALFHLSAAGVLATSYAELLERQEVHAREIRRLSEELIRDDLTNLYTRGYMDSMIRDRLAMRRRSDRRGALLFVDLDNFKTVNDTHGHPAGDMLLIAIAREIQGVLRDEDLAARWGGDEFLVFLPGADDKAVKQVAERLREAIGSVRIEAPDGGQISVTASIGYSPLSEKAVNAADLALFRAKAEGKDRVVSV